MSDDGAANVGKDAPFSGNKGNVFEGGIRVPYAARWPAVLPQGVPCMTMDFSPSIVRAAGAQAPRPFDGIDVLELLKTGQPVQSGTLFWRARRGTWTRRAVRDGDMKFISLENTGKVQEYLFDLGTDPQGKNNLLARQSETVERLRRLLKEWEDKVRPHRRWSHGGLGDGHGTPCRATKKAPATAGRGTRYPFLALACCNTRPRLRRGTPNCMRLFPFCT
jgi:arylsulfatase A-like enzyme